MPPARSRYVTACQQLLALGVVVVALAPATRVVSLDVVAVPSGQGAAQPTIAGSGVELSAQRQGARPARVKAGVERAVPRSPRAVAGFG